MLLLRALNPVTERPLFETAYNWRSKPRKNRMSFEDFAADDPAQIVLGLFNSELQAVYLFHQISPTEFGAHFTSSRTAHKEDVLAGARELVRWFEENGLEIVAHITPRNIPLRRFVESVGLTPEKVLQFDTGGATVPATTQLWVEYRTVKVNSSGVKLKKADKSGNDGHDRKLRLSNPS